MAELTAQASESSISFSSPGNTSNGSVNFAAATSMDAVLRELANARSEKARAEAYLRAILRDLQEKAPAFASQRAEWQAAVTAAQQMGEQLSEAQRELHSCKMELVAAGEARIAHA